MISAQVVVAVVVVVENKSYNGARTIGTLHPV